MTKRPILRLVSGKPEPKPKPARGLVIGAERRVPPPRIPGRPVQPAPGPRTISPDEFVRYDGDSHLITFGPTGSGKTTGPVIINALDHRGSAIIVDPKGDVYDATADYRRNVLKQEVVLLDMRGPNPASGSFNPFDPFILAGGDINLIARTIANALVMRDPAEQAFWFNWALTMLTGGTAYVIGHEAPSRRNIARLFDLFNGDDVVYNLALLLDQNVGKFERCIYSAFAGFLQLSERETRPSVLGSTQQHLMLWESDFIRGLTDTTSFDLQGLVDGRPMSLYIVPGPMRVEACAPLLRLWFAGIVAAMQTRQGKPLPAERTLMLCDEAAVMGKLDAFVTASTLLRSCGLQLWTFWQNPAQLEVYGSAARTIIDNAGVVQLLGVRNQRMAREFAELVGGVSSQDIMAMSCEDQVVSMSGSRPKQIRRVRYFETPLIDRDTFGMSDTWPTVNPIFDPTFSGQN